MYSRLIRLRSEGSRITCPGIQGTPVFLSTSSPHLVTPRHCGGKPIAPRSARAQWANFPAAGKPLPPSARTSAAGSSAWRSPMPAIPLGPDPVLPQPTPTTRPRPSRASQREQRGEHGGGNQRNDPQHPDSKRHAATHCRGRRVSDGSEQAPRSQGDRKHDREQDSSSQAQSQTANKRGGFHEGLGMPRQGEGRGGCEAAPDRRKRFSVRPTGRVKQPCSRRPEADTWLRAVA